MSRLSEHVVRQRTDFGDLSIEFDDRILRPRPWTLEQSRWASALLDDLPPGPVLELCAGAGHIGLAAVAGSRRRLVSVDVDPLAARYAAANATAAGLAARVEVREAALEEALSPGELFTLVIADPPWVPRAQVDRFPDDPVLTIDGGEDGLELARRCLVVIGSHLATRGMAILQLGTVAQAEALAPAIEGAGLHTATVRTCDGGVLLALELIA